MPKKLIIGSSKSCDVVLSNRYVNAEHATLTIDGDSVLIEDLNSNFGTYVNGEKIEASRYLRKVDRVKIGGLSFNWKDYLSNEVDDNSSIYFRDLFTTSGEISWSTYKYVLLITPVLMLLLLMGTPAFFMVLPYLTSSFFEYSDKNGVREELNNFYLNEYSLLTALLLIVIVAYVFLNLTFKFLRKQLD